MSKLKVDQISKATGASPAIFTLPAADGTVNQHLKTDGSGQLGWATPVTNKPAFHVYLTATQSIPNAAYTKIQLETAILDTASGFNLTASGTNPYAYTVSVAGTYLIQTSLSIDNMDSSEFARLTVYKNGARDYTADVSQYADGTNDTIHIGKCFMMYLAVDDYIELWVYHNEGASQNITGVRNFLSGFKIL